MYEYKAKVVRVIDGDTVVLNVDLGFRTWHESPFRLYGIDSPEVNVKGPEGEAARDFLKTLLPEGMHLRTTTYKSADKYGRWLCTILRDGDISTIGEQMIAAGHAIPYDGGAR